MRASELVARMATDEKLTLVHTHYGTPIHGRPASPGAMGSAGFAPGVPRLGIPDLQETDAGLGVANPTNAPFDATALPSGVAVAATFDQDLAEMAGDVVGAEAHAMGFSVLLGGGANLVREPRGGRVFEYAGEDPLLAGTMAGATIRGAQRNGVVATLKHFALNPQENGRVLYDARLRESSARESDLLAFEMALEAGHPGAVMTGYNKVDGVYASENRHMISDILKRDWGFPGWVMSDWGATHSTVAAALAGLDQESGEENDAEVVFAERLGAAVADGSVPATRLDDMVHRILRSRIVAGQLDGPAPASPRKLLSPEMLAAHADVAQRAAEQAIVLLKNDRDLLPLRVPARVLVIGSHADFGVLSGGGSSQVVPVGALRMPGEPPGMFYGNPKLYDPSSPLDALRRDLPAAAVTYDDGSDVVRAARLAADVDVAIVFAEQWSVESRDSPDLTLPGNQNALISAIAAANAKTVVVLETGHAVTMPWLSSVSAVIEAWYPGERGGAAIAAVLYGRVDPSGRLPISFPADEAQLPRPALPRREDTRSNPDDPPGGEPFALDFDIEGADIGYKWDLRRKQTPLFPFGYGLSYARFATSGLAATLVGDWVKVTFDVANIGSRAGIDTPQVYVEAPGFTRRLAGWQRAVLAPGETRRVSLTIDPRLLARYDEAGHAWRIDEGDIVLAVRDNALAEAPTVRVHLPERSWPARHQNQTAAQPNAEPGRVP